MASAIIAPGTTDLSDYTSRRVTIEVTGGCHPQMMRMGVYTITIPYRCFSQTIQGIHRLGGKVTRVTLPHHSGDVLPLPKETESISPPPQPQQPKNSTNTRQTTKPTNGTQGQRSKRKPKS